MGGNDNFETDQDVPESVEDSQEFPFYLGKDKSSKWFTMPTVKRLNNLPFIRKPFTDAKSPLDSWKLEVFVTDNMMNEITLHTNQKIQEKAASYSNENKYKVKQTTPQKLYSLFGLLYLAGFCRSGR